MTSLWSDHAHNIDVRRTSQRSVLLFLAAQLLLAFQASAAPAGKVKACFVRFWVPESWRVSTTALDNGFSVDIAPPEGHGPHLRLEARRGSFRDVASDWGFTWREGRWTCLMGQDAIELKGKPRGFRCGFPFRSYDREGHYEGQGDAESAALLFRHHTVFLTTYGSTPFEDILGSIRIAE